MSNLFRILVHSTVNTLENEKYYIFLYDKQQKTPLPPFWGSGADRVEMYLKNLNEQKKKLSEDISASLMGGNLNSPIGSIPIGEAPIERRQRFLAEPGLQLIETE